MVATKNYGLGVRGSGQISPSTGNVGFNSDIVDKYVNSNLEINYKQNCRVFQMFNQDGAPAGALRREYVRMEKVGRTATSGSSDWTSSTPAGFTTLSSNTSTTNPTSRTMQTGGKILEPKLYTIVYDWGSIADMFNKINTKTAVMSRMFDSATREMDLLAQEYLVSQAATDNNFNYPDGISGVSGFTRANSITNPTTHFTPEDIVWAAEEMDFRGAPKFESTGTYMMVIPNEACGDLFGKASNANSLTAIFQHSDILAKRVVSGAVGIYHDMTVVKSNNLVRTTNGQSGNDLVTIHQAFVFGAGACVAWPTNITVNYVNQPDHADTNSLVDQVGMWFLFNVLSLNRDGWMVMRRSTSRSFVDRSVT